MILTESLIEQEIIDKKEKIEQLATELIKELNYDSTSKNKRK